MQSSKNKISWCHKDESMNWEEQLKTIKRKIKNGLGAMFKLKNILSQKQLATVYALIESHLRYCSVIWGCLSNTKLNPLQNRARRLIECARHKDGWVCDWLDVRNLIKYDQLITTYKWPKLPLKKLSRWNEIPANAS